MRIAEPGGGHAGAKRRIDREQFHRHEQIAHIPSGGACRAARPRRLRDGTGQSADRPCRSVRRRVLVRRPRVAAANRGDRARWPTGTAARLGRRGHRRFRRQLHRAGVWTVRRPPVRRIRAALPQARCSRRAHRPGVESAELGAAELAVLRPLRARRGSLRRDPVRRCDFRGSAAGRGAHDRRIGDRPELRFAFLLHAEDVRRVVLGSQLRAAVARRGGIVGRARRAVPCDHRKLRGHVRAQTLAARLPRGALGRRGAPGRAHDAGAEGASVLRRRDESPVSPSRRRRRLGQPGPAGDPGHPGGVRGAAPGRAAHAARRRAQACRVRRQFPVDASARLGSGTEGAGCTRHSVAGDRGADRPLFVRSGRAPARHRGALEDVGAHTQFRGHRRQWQPGFGRGDAGPEARDLCRRRVVRRARRCEGTRVSQRAADIVRAAIRSGRPAPRGSR